MKAISNSSLRYELRMRAVVTLAAARQQAEAIATVLTAERFQRPFPIHRVEVLSSSDSEAESVKRTVKKKKKKGNDSKNNSNSKNKNSDNNVFSNPKVNGGDKSKNLINQGPSLNGNSSHVNSNIPPVQNKVSQCSDNRDVRPSSPHNKIVNDDAVRKNTAERGEQNFRGGGNYGYNPNYRNGYRGRGNGKRAWWQRNMWDNNPQTGQVERAGYPKEPRAQE